VKDYFVQVSVNTRYGGHGQQALHTSPTASGGGFGLDAAGQISESKGSGRPYQPLASSSRGCPLCLGT
jgi:hypothetical protein